MSPSISTRRLKKAFCGFRRPDTISVNVAVSRTNEHGALVHDDGVSGAVIILMPKHWKAIVDAVKVGQS